MHTIAAEIKGAVAAVALWLLLFATTRDAAFAQGFSDQTSSGVKVEVVKTEDVYRLRLSGLKQEPAGAKALALSNPARVALDIQEPVGVFPGKVPISLGNLTQLRFGRGGGMSRFVLDIREPYTVADYTLNKTDSSVTVAFTLSGPEKEVTGKESAGMPAPAGATVVPSLRASASPSPRQSPSVSPTAFPSASVAASPAGKPVFAMPRVLAPSPSSSPALPDAKAPISPKLLVSPVVSPAASPSSSPTRPEPAPATSATAQLRSGAMERPSATDSAAESESPAERKRQDRGPAASPTQSPQASASATPSAALRKATPSASPSATAQASPSAAPVVIVASPSGTASPSRESTAAPLPSPEEESSPDASAGTVGSLLEEARSTGSGGPDGAAHTVTGIFFRKSESGGSPALLIQLSSQTPYTVRQLEQGVQELILDNTDVARRELLLPQFPPYGFDGFLALDVKRQEGRLIIRIHIDDGTTLEPFTKGNDLWVRVARLRG